MNDPILEGALSLGEAYALHYCGRYGVPPSGLPDTSYRQTVTIGEIIQAFQTRALEAFVRFPGASENVRLLPNSWREQFFAERVFFSPDISVNPDIPGNREDPWSPFNGRTPFVVEESFIRWSAEASRKFCAADPLLQSSWTYGQAIAWIISRSSDGVRQFGSSYVVQGVMEASGSYDRQQKVMSVTDADFQLRQALGEGAFSASAIDTSGQPCTIQKIDWPYLDHITNDDGADQFGLHDDPFQVRYHDVRLPRSEIIKKWPGTTPRESEALPSDGGTVRDGEKVVALTAGQQRIARAVAAAFPDGQLPGKAADRNRLVIAQYSDQETPPSIRSIERFYKKISDK